MSAFMVDKEHIDAIVTIALFGPRGMEGDWERPRWEAHDPRVTEHDAQEYRECVREHDASRYAVTISPDRLGDILWTENERSIEARYPSDHAEMLTADYCLGYRYQPWSRIGLTHAEAFKAIDCLEYQSCEHDDWRDSEAKRFLDVLRGALIGTLPGYGAAKWEVSCA